MTKRKKKNKNHYFTHITEEAIVKYCATEDQGERSKLYIEQIQPAFDELVDKIVYTYKFTSLENIDHLRDDCKIWLTTILAKFNPNQGTKAFSYFSVVTKNWFTHKAKKQNQKNRREINYDSMIREIEAVSAESSTNFYDSLEDQQFWEFLLKEIRGWQQLTLKPNEEKVLNAVLTLMDNIEQIEIFNKKAVYLYMREITGLNTKQIVGCLNKMRARYRIFRKKWDEGEFN
jgi:DNA-directed RNA polymerase specialized sigma subunit